MEGGDSLISGTQFAHTVQKWVILSTYQTKEH